VIIEDELLFSQTGIDHHIWETMGQLNRRIGRPEPTLAFSRTFTPRHSKAGISYPMDEEMFIIGLAAFN
jgi:hypothetical protein